MTHPSALPPHSDIVGALTTLGSDYTAAQIHGLMCGLMCSNLKLDQWRSYIQGIEKAPKAAETLQTLYETTEHLLLEFSFEFNLLLPEDSLNIKERVEALGLWCQGFLTGLEKNGVPLKNREPSDITEAINDLLDISEVSYSDVTENEEDETAYFELVEYVRLAVLMIFHELSLSPKMTKKDDLLH